MSRRGRCWAVAGSVLLFVFSTACYVGFVREYESKSLAGLATIFDEFPRYDPDAAWADPGITHCGKDFCKKGLDLKAPAGDGKVVAAVSVYGWRAPNSFQSLAGFVWGPRDFLSKNVVARSVDVPDDVDTAADIESLDCYRNPLGPENDRCIWTYWGVYGQYLFGVNFSSAAVVLTAQEFTQNYVVVLDRYVGELLELD